MPRWGDCLGHLKLNNKIPKLGSFWNAVVLKLVLFSDSDPIKPVNTIYFDPPSGKVDVSEKAEGSKGTKA